MGSTPILSSMAIVAFYAVIAVFVLFSLWAGWDSGYDAGWLDGNLNRSRTFLQVMDDEVEHCDHCAEVERLRAIERAYNVLVTMIAEADDDGSDDHA